MPSLYDCATYSMQYVEEDHAPSPVTPHSHELDKALHFDSKHLRMPTNDEQADTQLYRLVSHPSDHTWLTEGDNASNTSDMSSRLILEHVQKTNPAIQRIVHLSRFVTSASYRALVNCIV